jgi:DNA-binding transcriptional ArsR family regulator
VRQSLLAFHLKALTTSGLVRDQRRGRWVFYSIKHEAIDRLIDLLQSLVTAGAHESCCAPVVPIRGARARATASRD